MSHASTPSASPAQTPGPQPARSSLRALLVALALLTVAAMAERALRLSAPMPKAEAPSVLRLPGYGVTPLEGAPPRRGRELSHGTLRRFRLQPLSGGEPLTLLLLPVRSRTGTEFSQPSKERQGLNMVAVAEEVPPFALRERRILTLPRAQGAAPGTKRDQVALGRGPKDRARTTSRLQTCLTPSGHAGVNAFTLVGEAEGMEPGARGSALERQWKRLAGLLQSRHECLAVQVEREGSDRRVFLGAWRDLKRVLVAP